MNKLPFDPEEVYMKGRDRSNFYIGIALGFTIAFCAGVIYVVSLVERVKI